MIDYLIARKIILDHAQKMRELKPGAEVLTNFDRAHKKILARPVYAPENVPSFTNSAMDGFAVSSLATLGASTFHPLKLKVQGMIAAGPESLRECDRANTSSEGEMSAVEIMTGAPLPTQVYDAVVRIEDVQVERDSEGKSLAISLTKAIPPGENVRVEGSDFQRGQFVMGPGIFLSAEHLMALAGLGINELYTKKLPRVAIISTGSELSDAASLAPGMIRNSSGPYLVNTLAELGCEVINLGVVRDDPAIYALSLESALAKGADLIISTGAVSMGKYDFVGEVLKEMGAEIHFHKVKIRPGKPILFADFFSRQHPCAFFGLPGNPISTAVGLHFFVWPYLRKMLGLSSALSAQAKLSEEVKRPSGMRCFYKAKVEMAESGLQVTVLKNQSSHVISSLLQANCWAELPEGESAMPAGSAVTFYPLNCSFEKGVYCDGN